MVCSKFEHVGGEGQCREADKKEVKEEREYGDYQSKTLSTGESHKYYQGKQRVQQI